MPTTRTQEAVQHFLKQRATLLLAVLTFSSLIATINRTTRALAFDTPGLESKFRLPRVANDQALLNAARAFAADATPLKAAFVKLEMPADFLARLNQLSADFEQTTTEKATAVGRACRRHNLARRSRRARLTRRPPTRRRHPQQIQRRPRRTGELDARQPHRLLRPQHSARAAPIQQIEIIRSQQFIHTRLPLKTEDAFTISDNQPLTGESYYYVRVRQVDDQMAWSSPIWIQR